MRESKSLAARRLRALFRIGTALSHNRASTLDLDHVAHVPRPPQVAALVRGDHAQACGEAEADRAAVLLTGCGERWR